MSEDKSIHYTPFFKHLTGCEKFTGEATDIGWLSGKEKLRLKLGDKTKRFAIALFSDEEMTGVDKSKSSGTLGIKEWVKLTLDNDVKVYADVASIARRFGLEPSKVIEMADEENLENVLQTHINDYVNILNFVKENYNDKSIEEIDKTLNKLQVNIINHHINELITTLRKKLREKEDKDIPSFMSKAKNQLSLAIDKHFKIRQPITEDRGIREGLILRCDYTAIGFRKSKGEAAVRLELGVGELEIREGSEYAIKTDGYIYSKRPKISDEYIPYSWDGGNNWILLNINSLSYRLCKDKNELKGLKESFLKAAKEDHTGKELFDLISLKVGEKKDSKPTPYIPQTFVEYYDIEYEDKNIGIEYMDDDIK